MDVNRFLYFVYYYKKRDDPRGKDILAKHRVDGVVKDFLLQNCDVMPKIWNNGNGFVLRDVTLSSYVLSGRHSRQWIPGNFGAAMRVKKAQKSLRTRALIGKDVVLFGAERSPIASKIINGDIWHAETIR
eukprot:636129_1